MADDPIQQQFIDARRNQIIDAAVQVFAEKGFHRATIKDVAKAAGIADGTIYNYFANKTALLEGIFNRLNQSDQREEDFAAADDTDPKTFFRQYLGQRYEVIGQNEMQMLQIVLAELMTSLEMRELYLKQVYEPTVEIGERHFDQQAQRGVLKIEDTALTVRVIAALTLGISLLRILGDQTLIERWDELPDFITNFVWNSIGNKK